MFIIHLISLIHLMPGFAWACVLTQDSKIDHLTQRLVISFQYRHAPNLSRMQEVCPPIKSELRLLASKRVCESLKIKPEARSLYDQAVERSFELLRGKTVDQWNLQSNEDYDELSRRILKELDHKQQTEIRENWYYLELKYLDLPQFIERHQRDVLEPLNLNDSGMDELRRLVADERKKLKKKLSNRWAECVDDVVAEIDNLEIDKKELKLWKSPYTADISAQIALDRDFKSRLKMIQQRLNEPVVKLVLTQLQSESDIGFNFDIKEYSGQTASLLYVLSVVSESDYLNLLDEQSEQIRQLLLEFNRNINDLVASNLRNGKLVKSKYEPQAIALAENLLTKVDEDVFLAHQRDFFKQDLRSFSAIVYGLFGLLKLRDVEPKHLEAARKTVSYYAQDAIALENEFLDAQLNLLNPADRGKIAALIGKRPEYLLSSQVYLNLRDNVLR